MTQKFLKKLVVLSLLFLIIPFSYFPVSTGTWNQNTSPTIQNTDGFVEDFTTTTYRDSGATNAYGWGMDTLTNKKNLTMTQLDFEASTYPIKSIDVQGRKTYAVQYNPSSGADSLNIYSINDPSNIYRTGYRNSLPRLSTIAVSGDFVFVGRDPSTPYITTYNYSNTFTTGNHLGNLPIDGTVPVSSPFCITSSPASSLPAIKTPVGINNSPSRAIQLLEPSKALLCISRLKNSPSIDPPLRAHKYPSIGETLPCISPLIIKVPLNEPSIGLSGPISTEISLT